MSQNEKQFGQVVPLCTELTHLKALSNLNDSRFYDLKRFALCLQGNWTNSKPILLFSKYLIFQSSRQVNCKPEQNVTKPVWKTNFLHKRGELEVYSLWSKCLHFMYEGKLRTAWGPATPTELFAPWEKDVLC